MECKTEGKLVADLLEAYNDAKEDCNKGIRLQCGRANTLRGELDAAIVQMQVCIAAQPLIPLEACD